MTRKRAEHNERPAPFDLASPDPAAILEMEAARYESERAIDGLIALVNAALETCTERQATIWRLVTGVCEDGTVREAQPTRTIAKMLDQNHISVRGGFLEAHSRVLSRILSQQLPAANRQAMLELIAGTGPESTVDLRTHTASDPEAGAKYLQQDSTQLSLLPSIDVPRQAADAAQSAHLNMRDHNRTLHTAMQAPETRKGRMDQVATDNARIDASMLEQVNASLSVNDRTSRARFGDWEREMPKGKLDVQGAQWQRFHQRQLERIDNARKAREGQS